LKVLNKKLGHVKKNKTEKKKRVKYLKMLNNLKKKIIKLKLISLIKTIKIKKARPVLLLILKHLLKNNWKMKQERKPLLGTTSYAKLVSYLLYSTMMHIKLYSKG
ncbi:hypothetical protein, partial [Staphylococcus simulans]